MKPRFLFVLLALILLFVSVFSAVLIARRQAANDAGYGVVTPQPDTGEGSDTDDPEQTGPSNEQDPAPNITPSEARVSFLAAGDVVLHESVFLDANLRAGGSGASGSVSESSPYDFVSMYRFVAQDIQAADFAMVNQETLIGASASGKPSGYPNFSGPKAAGDALVEVGFDIVNIGNNHMLDVRTAGLQRSVDYWREKDVTLVGVYESRSAADEVCVLEKKGVKIACLTYLGNTPGTNGYEADSSVYIPYLNEELVRTQVARAKEVSDFVLVSVHWGNEGTYTPNSEQKKHAQLFASLGVDALICTHPHVLQPMMWVERTEYSGGGKMLLCYSLGDFLSHTQLGGGKNSKGNLLGGYVKFDIVKEEGTVRMENVTFVPTVSHYDEGQPLDTGFYIYPLSEYTDALLRKFGDPAAGFTSKQQLIDIVNLNISAEFLKQ